MFQGSHMSLGPSSFKKKILLYTRSYLFSLVRYIKMLVLKLLSIDKYFWGGTMADSLNFTFL